MQRKLKFLSVLVVVFSIMCLASTVFGAKEMFINKKLNLKYSDGILTWSKIFGPDYNDVYYEVSIRLNNLEYIDEHSTSQSVNVKEIFDSKGKATGTYKAQVIARGESNSIITTETVNFSYTSSQDKLDAPSNLRWDGKIARWNASPNATSYRILLLSATGGNVVTYTTNDLEYDFTNTSGFAVYEGYYFTVVAMADGYRNSSENESPKYKEATVEKPTTGETKTYTIKVKMYDNDSKNENLGGEISLTTGAYHGQTMFKDREIVEDFPEGLPITLVARPETGYQFVCWKKDNVTLTTEATYQFDSHAQDETYTAVFEKTTEASNKDEYTIRVKIYDNDSKKENVGGKISVTSGPYNGQNFFRTEEIVNDYEKGIAMTLVARADEGYKFVGWKTGDTTLATETVYQFTTSTKDETYTAVFAKESTQTEQPNQNVKYKVEFNSNGGSVVATQEVAEKAMKPANPTKDGYTFDGWYTDEQLTKTFDFNSAINNDITLYAKWSENKKEEQLTTSTEPTTNPEQPTEVKKENWSNASDWAKEELYKVNEENLMPWIFEKEDLTVNITRREFAYVAVKLYEKITNEKLVESKENPFTDTSDIEVLKAYNVGITNGTSETTFEPDALITREQMATMMTRALNKAGIDTKVDLSKVSKFADDSEMHDWGKEAIYFMSNIEIIKGIGNNTFNVLGNATREQALLISVRSAAKFSRAK